MKLATHNSATGGKLLWWLRPLVWVINPTSKCQSRSIAQQLADGVKVFNLQVAYVNGKWRFTHGLAVYEDDVFDTLALMRLCASVKEPIYFQLYLDKCIWATNSETAFAGLVANIKKQFCCQYFVMLSAWVEGTDKYPHKSEINIPMEEHYWTLGWAKLNANKWVDKLPLPKYHAKKYNAKYKRECKKDYLMLDFYNYL